jgi:cytochrome P450
VALMNVGLAGDLRRRVVGALLRWRGGQRHGDSASLLGALPRPALVPLRRDALDPVPELAQLRDHAPVSRLKLPLGVRAWLVTGYEQSRTLLADTGAFSNDFRNLVGTGGVVAEQDPGGLGFSDPPVHTRLRHMLTPEFTMRRLARLAPRIEAIVDGQLDEIAVMERQGGPVDLYKSFALPIPSLTICELLGIPYADREWFQRLSVARFDLLGGASGSLGAVTESVGYLRQVVRNQRASPGEGLLGRLIAEHGAEITDDELAGLADGLLTGGLETTVSMLALGTLVLLQNPDTLTALHDSDETVAGVVEELLRYLSVVQVAFPRFARRDVEVDGQRIRAGDIVLCSLSGANRDPAYGDDLERFDPERRLPHHLAFGHGAHRCIGAELARMELRAAYPALIRRFPGIKLAAPPEDLPFRHLSFVYGVDALPVTLS